ncbi:MAG TPA: Gldg family protein [Candidatus Nitrosotalea sp.]|nr:Gldg family protein [Candidatus Nitrosotalea sp.]
MSSEPLITRSFSPSRRWAILLNVVVSCLAMLAVVVMVNYIASQHFKRFHWTRDTRYQLSPLTLRMLGTLTNNINVIVYFDAQEPLFSSVKELIQEYQLACPRLKVEFVDYVRSPNRAALVKAQYKLNSASDKNLVIFDNGSHTPWVVYEKVLSDYDWAGVMSGGKEVRRTAFKGERYFTSAIVNVSEPKRLKAYFLKGHKEHDPESEDGQSGYARFAQLLQERNISAIPLSLQTNEVPSDCQLLVIAGPQTALSQLELENVESYLSRGGRALILLMNTLAGGALNSRLERVLANWGVEVGDDFVYDKSQGNGQPSTVLQVSHFGEHPIVKPLFDAQLGMVVPRSIRRLPSAPQNADTAKVTELALTSESGVAVRNVKSNRGTVEATGAIPLAVAVEKGAIQGVKADRGATRMVIVGDSYSLVNAFIDNLANLDFANLAVNWLLDRSQLMDIDPKPVLEYKVFVSETNMNRARWVLLGAMPGAVLVLGFLVWLRRRK